MKASEINTILLENYLGLIKNLSPEIKLNLIEKIIKSLKNSSKDDTTSIQKAFGAWKSTESADEIILKIKESRNFNRKIEDL